MKSLMDIFRWIDTLTVYLQEREFVFSPEGYPLFNKEMFLIEKPELIVPVNHRKDKRVKNKKKTLIAFFCGDIEIYRRLEKLLDEIEEYRPYMGVIGFDITVTKDMEIEWQRAIILLNQLVIAVFAVNGIKIILNTRMGSVETRDMFRYIPKGIVVASGFRGGTRKYEKTNFEYISKIITLLSDKVLIYGKCHKSVLAHLNQLGVAYYVYSDFRELCKEVV